MRKIYLLLLLPLLFSIGSSAQKMMRYSDVEQIGDASTSYYYKYTHNELGKNEETVMVLQIGDKIQKFTSFFAYLSDSLGLALGNKTYDTKFLGRESSKIRRHREAKNDLNWTVYLNHPEGYNTITDRVFTDYFSSKEKSIIPTWKLSSESQMIEGYQCQKATTELHGRTWTVWFAPEIERPYGPWLLRGLPGLIVQAEEDSGELRFELLRIERRKTPIIFSNHDFFNATREQVLETKRKYYENMAQYVQGTDIGAQMSDIPNRPPIIINPLRKIGN